MDEIEELKKKLSLVQVSVGDEEKEVPRNIGERNLTEIWLAMERVNLAGQWEEAVEKIKGLEVTREIIREQLNQKQTE